MINQWLTPLANHSMVGVEALGEDCCPLFILLCKCHFKAFLFPFPLINDAECPCTPLCLQDVGVPPADPGVALVSRCQIPWPSGRVCASFNRLHRSGEGEKRGGLHLHVSWWQTCLITAERAAASLLPKSVEASRSWCPCYN